MREGQSLSPALARASRLGGTRPAGRREGRGGTSSLRVVLHLVSAQGRRGRTRRRGDSDLQVVAKCTKDSGFSRAACANGELILPAEQGGVLICLNS